MTSGSCTLRLSVRWALYTFINMTQNLSRTQLWPEYKLSEEMERETAVLSANRVQGWPTHKKHNTSGETCFHSQTCGNKLPSRMENIERNVNGMLKESQHWALKGTSSWLKHLYDVIWGLSKTIWGNAHLLCTCSWMWLWFSLGRFGNPRSLRTPNTSYAEATSQHNTIRDM